MLSEKGKKLLVLNNYKFSKAHTSKCGKIRWRCVNRKCSAKIFTADDEITVIKIHVDHSHEEDATINRQIVNNSLKRKVIELVSIVFIINASFISYS